MGGKRTEQPRPAVSQRLQDMVERAKKKHGVAPQPKPLPTPVRSTTPPPNTNPVPGSGSREVAPAPKTPSKSPGPPTPEPMSVQSNRSTPITQDCKRLRMASTSTLSEAPSELPSLPCFSSGSYKDKPHHLDSASTIVFDLSKLKITGPANTFKLVPLDLHIVLKDRT